MLRLFGVIISLACCTFAQLQAVPVTVMDTPRPACSCCDNDGSCGMPDCLPPASPAPTFVAANQPAPIVSHALRRAARPVQRTEPSFFAASFKASANSTAARLAVQSVPSASEPLFRVHCSFLI